jgi:competence protein ComEC
MPMGILGIVTMPLGLDAEFWRQMGYGIEWMNAVGLWVASLPGAFGRVSLFGVGPLLLATAGFLVIGLLKTPLRWSGVLAVIAAAIWAAAAPRPDVLIAGDGRGFAVRGANGRFAVHQTGGDSFAAREWLAADADGRDVHDKNLGHRGSPVIRLVAAAGSPTALWSVTRSPRTRTRKTAPALHWSSPRRGDPPIERALWRQRGALTLRRNGSDRGTAFLIDSARVKNFDRPWSPAPAPRETIVSTPGEGSQADAGNRGRDATPRQEDIEADQ